MPTAVEISSVSWIDRKNLPTPGLTSLAEALAGGRIGWDDRTVIGLIATSNPAPPKEIGDVGAFLKQCQYRAVAAMKVRADLQGLDGKPTLDPGWTPPFDKGKLPLVARLKTPPAKALEQHRGESSALSTVSSGKQLPISSLRVPMKATVVGNMLIKFRAGEATNDLGRTEAHSPFHVPWVWCETLLVRAGNRLTLLACGSSFPSHAWYVNGRQVAMTLQKPVHAKPDEPAISTGQPISRAQERAEADRSEGPVTKHQYTVGAGQVHTVDLGPHT